MRRRILPADSTVLVACLLLSSGASVRKLKDAAALRSALAAREVEFEFGAACSPLPTPDLPGHRASRLKRGTIRVPFKQSRAGCRAPGATCVAQARYL